MAILSKPLYVPALRMKAGELSGVRNLAPDIANCILPRMIIPPPKERNIALQVRLLETEPSPDVSGILSTHWIGRDVLLEATYLVHEFGRDRMDRWFPKMFDMARKLDVRAIPLVRLTDLLAGNSAAYKGASDQIGTLRFGLIISSGDFADTERVNRCLDILYRIGLRAEQCLVIADFHDADFSQPNLVAPVIAGVMNTLQALGRWQQIIFQGTNYPEKNPAAPDSCCLVPRNEWAAYQLAVSSDPPAADEIIFGDYAADCAKIIFGGGGIPIPHYRYTTTDSWLVQRAKDDRKHEVNMQNVCEKIVASRGFAGRTFSSADDYIYRTAKGEDGPGNAKEWRSINTTHHITRVVTDVGAIRGIQFNNIFVKPLGQQIPLFT